MKFIVDAQLPKKLSFFFQSKGYDSIHTLDLTRKNSTSDQQIIDIAQVQERVVITKDEDFLESQMINSIPEKLILVKTGNIHNKQLIHIFELNLNVILEMIERSSLVVIHKEEIIEQGKKY